eukprot:scaffold642_cov280-Prasinococcus_capsulatus_cf.AAC.2
MGSSSVIWLSRDHACDTLRSCAGELASCSARWYMASTDISLPPAPSLSLSLMRVRKKRDAQRTQRAARRAQHCLEARPIPSCRRHAHAHAPAPSPACAPGDLPAAGREGERRRRSRA